MLLAELQQALRALLRRPAFSVSVVLTLATALAATIAAFALVNSVLLRPLPYPGADRIMVVWNSVGDSPRVRQTEMMHLHYRNDSRAFGEMALAEPTYVTYDDGTRARRIRAATVTAPIFAVLGVGVDVGRQIVEDDTVPGAEDVVVLSRGFWERDFGSDPTVISRSIRIEGRARRVIGVLPATAQFPEPDVDLWLPHVIDPARPVPFNFVHTGYGRLRDGVDLDAARADMGRVNRTLSEAYPDYFTPAVLQAGHITPAVVPLTEAVVGDVRSTLWIFLAAVIGFLLVATANVANLVLARHEGRQREIALRHALGASRFAVARFALIESWSLALVSGALGLVVAATALEAFKRAAPNGLPRLETVAVEPAVAAFALMSALVVGGVLGLAPTVALRSRVGHQDLAGAARTTGSSNGVQLRRVLVVVQVALSLTLLAGAGMLVRSFWSVSRVDPGFDVEDRVGMRVALLDVSYPTQSEAQQFLIEALDRLRDTPGVTGAAAASYLPLRDGRTYQVWDVDEMPLQPGDLPRSYLTKAVSEGYFATMGIPLLHGRDLHRDDLRREGERPVIVNTVLAEAVWSRTDVLGKRLRHGGAEGAVYVIAGVVGGVRDRSLIRPPEPMAYVPMYPGLAIGLDLREMSFVVRTAQEQSVIPAIRDQIHRRDREVPLMDVRLMQRVVQDATARTRMAAVALGAASLGGLFLGVIGLYGLLSYSVGTRTREIGVRLALGAEPAHVARGVLAEAMVLALAGVALGAIGAVGATYAVGAVLSGLGGLSLTIVGVVAIVLLCSALLAAGVPARRASRLNPLAALQNPG